MGILRNSQTETAGKKGFHPGGGSIEVRCPKCQAIIYIAGVDGHEPVRCRKCRYPLIRNGDLRVIVDACRNISKPNQAETAVRVLRNMLEYMPEAGTALGELAGRQSLPMSERDKWDCLTAAYARGDENAREWLDQMCRTSPDQYRQSLCGNCGAPKYVLKGARAESPCVYCRQAK